MVGAAVVGVVVVGVGDIVGDDVVVVHPQNARTHGCNRWQSDSDISPELAFVKRSPQVIGVENCGIVGTDIIASKFDIDLLFNKAWSDRCRLSTTSSGKVNLKLDIVLRNFHQHDVDF